MRSQARRLVAHGWSAGVRLASAAIVAVLLPAAPAQSQAQIGDAMGAAQAVVKDAAAAQRRIDEIDDATAALKADTRAIRSQTDAIRGYNLEMTRLLSDQEAKMASLQAQIARVTTIEREVVPLMQRMIAALDAFVSLDLPFLSAERRGRVDALRELMDRADAPVAEKFRRLLEAYQIENDYGRTIESYRDTIRDEETGAVTVDVLRIGRVALLHQTIDGGRTALWDPARGAWIALGDDFDKPVRHAIAVARREVPPDMLIVPVKSAAPARLSELAP